MSVLGNAFVVGRAWGWGPTVLSLLPPVVILGVLVRRHLRRHLHAATARGPATEPADAPDTV